MFSATFLWYDAGRKCFENKVSATIITPQEKGWCSINQCVPTVSCFVWIES